MNEKDFWDGNVIKCWKSVFKETIDDYIICDAPPVGIITDAAALSPLCDGVLYVIRQKYANKNQVHDAIRRLQAVNAKILGVVLTQCKNSQRSRYKYGRSGYGYRYGYGYGSHQNDTK